MSEMISGLVTTVIPVRNRPQMLREAVDSVLAQTYRPIEIVIVDDGSTDDTPRVAEELVKQYPEIIRFYPKENSGPGPTRELGRVHARGEFIQYLDSDDLLRPTKFELMVEALRKNPECGAAYGFICVHPVGQPPKKTPFKGSGDSHEYLFPRLLYDRWWNTNCPLWRRSVCDAIGSWSDLRWSQDWEYDGRAGALRTKLVHVPEWVCDERHHTSGRQTNPANWLEPFRLRERIRFLQLIYKHAETAGVEATAPERQHFARWVFATARNCAAVGLKQESLECMQLAERAAGGIARVRKGFGAFRLLTRVLGFRVTGQLSILGQRIKRPSGMTLQQAFAKKID